MVKINNIEYYLPNAVVTNSQLKEENPSWDMDRVLKRTGVKKRHIASDDETALDLSFKACEKLFSNEKINKNKVDGIIFCTQSEDYIMPPNSCLLHKMLDLQDDVFAFDFNLACSGFIYGIAMAQGLIKTNIANNIILVNADTYSKYINKKDRSTRVLFGDGAAVTHIVKSITKYGVLDIQCSTSGKGYDKFIIPAGGCRIPKSELTNISKIDNNNNIRNLENIHMDGLGVLKFVTDKVPQQIHQILERNSMTLDDIDIFIFHQASKLAIDTLTRLLDIRPEKVFTNFQDTGNTVSASIPIALKDALNNNIIKKNDKILLCGFGVGLSWGTAIIQY